MPCFGMYKVLETSDIRRSDVRLAHACLAFCQQPAAILRLTSKAVIRNPSTVYRSSHLMTSNVLTHGSR